MLIFTRRLGETVIISQDKKIIAEITILGIKGNQVRLGFKAEKNIGMDREEIFRRKIANP